MTGSGSRKKTTTRTQRLGRRWKRVKSRWKRRARKARAVHKTVKRAPSKIRAVASKTRRAPATLARAARAKVAPNADVTCSCGDTVPAHQVQSHLDTHQRKHNTAQRRTQKKRAATAKRMGRTGVPAEPKTAARATTDPTAPTRREAAGHATGWIAVGGVLIALPLDGFGSAWMYAAAAGCIAIGPGVYAAERRWGTTNHISRESRRALKAQARAAGCNSACMTSTLPVRSCRCPCGGESHGGARKGRVAA